MTLFVVSEVEQEGPQDSVFRQYDIPSNFQITFLKIPRSRGSRIAYLFSVMAARRKIREALQSNKIDLVYGRDVLSCLIAARLGFNVAFEAHAPVWEGLVEGYCIKKLAHHPKFRGLVIITDALKQAYESRFPGIEKRCVVAPDGARIPRSIRSFKTLQGAKSALKVGYVGNLYQGKGMEIISVLANRMPDTEFHIVGGEPADIAFWKSKLLDNLFFYGFVSRERLPEYFDALDICLLPNQASVHASGASASPRITDIGKFTSPLKMFEYMAYRKAIIASDLPILREVLTDRSAVLVAPSDIDGWTRAIEFFSDHVNRKKFGDAAYRCFSEKYSWKHRAELILRDLKL